MRVGGICFFVVTMFGENDEQRTYFSVIVNQKRAKVLQNKCYTAFLTLGLKYYEGKGR